jgi:von Willebrand factor type A domain
MENLWQKYGGSIQFVAVNTRETVDNFKNWLNGIDQIWTYTDSNGITHNVPCAGIVGGVTFPALHGPGIVGLYVSGTYYWPLIYLIGADGKVKSIFDQGTLYTESDLEGHILDVVYQRPPVSLELVVDVSSSMLSPAPGGPSADSKLVLLQQAANIVLDVIEDHGQSDDTVGLVRFTDNASEFEFGGKNLIAMSHISQLRGEITALPSFVGTCTAMGAGLQTAFDTLASEATHDRFAILCTDGMQNIEPKVTNVGGHFEIRNSGGWLCGGPSTTSEHPGIDILTYDTRVHTLGIGITANYQSLLQDIADATGGFYRGTNDPATDLDLIYMVDLCACLAKGSPAVVFHTAGTLSTEHCQAVETFCINRTARKLSIVVSWQKSQGTNLTFWLHAPDGALVKLDRQMKIYENYCIATVYLPVQQQGKKLLSVGQWTMVIRGETDGGGAGYHAMVVVEDREVKYQLDYPRKAYATGDILPLSIKLFASKKPITRISDIVMETAAPCKPLTSLLADFKVSRYELQKTELSRKMIAAVEAQIQEKLQAMEKEPRYAELLRPARKKLSLTKGELECKIGEGEITVPVALQQPGLHSFKVTVQCETAESGPICRTDIVSVFVGVGHPDPKMTNVAVVEAAEKSLTGAILYLTPKNERGHLLGPGWGHEIKATAEKSSFDVEVVDQLDGTYQVEIPLSKKARHKTLVHISLQGRLIWKGTL